MAGIVQQRRECRNAAAANVLTKNVAGRGYPGHAICQREEAFATPAYGLRVGYGSAAADSPPNPSDKPGCARRRKGS
jgi:hypothetical protein